MPPTAFLFPFLPSFFWSLCFFRSLSPYWPSLLLFCTVSKEYPERQLLSDRVGALGGWLPTAWTPEAEVSVIIVSIDFDANSPPVPDPLVPLLSVAWLKKVVETGGKKGLRHGSLRCGVAVKPFCMYCLHFIVVGFLTFPSSCCSMGGPQGLPRGTAQAATGSAFHTAHSIRCSCCTWRHRLHHFLGKSFDGAIAAAFGDSQVNA